MNLQSILAAILAALQLAPDIEQFFTDLNAVVAQHAPAAAVQPAAPPPATPKAS